MKIVAITTIDNPYCPIDEFDSWLAYDVSKNYGTLSYLARIARTSDLLTDEENLEETERAIDEIIKYDPFNFYKKIIKDE